MAGSAAKKKGNRGRCAPRIDGRSDSAGDAALFQALPTPASSQQQDAKSLISPGEKKKNSTASSVNSGSGDINPPAVACLGFHWVFSSWDDLEAPFESYQSDTFQINKLRHVKLD
ncbi:hypothetical protein L917_02667 [Phytophthora nicotianae]|uniref:Uncharacterized protein n=1 Tax=Phytophthora nicotianae TaxID=4792 RepID=W2LVJ0_PHYNI|nr:hypothetical protein L917_02667 [Phytophthora nicotianae]